MSADWTHRLRLHELSRGPVRLSLAPDGAARASIARDLSLESLPELTAELTISPWLDGAEVEGRFRATVEQICSVSLEPFQQGLQGAFQVRVLPAGSQNAPTEPGREMELDLDAPDPPDVLDGDAIDLAAYVVEHLALEIDPFPRKPGAEFDYSPPAETDSPFAALSRLKDPKP
jgi:uncharacterized metal-binding protein YceD (DUF177 family)